MNVLKSINIADDLRREEVVKSYRPTRKTLQVVSAIYGSAGSRATNVVAPYGGGKSIAALAGITLLVGKTGTAKSLQKRIESTDPNLANNLNASKSKNQVFLLHGMCPNLARELCRQAKLHRRDNLRDTLKAILTKARRQRIERVAIVWDEFGQHLETLVRDGRTEDLLAVQDIAEWTVRRTNPVVTFTTLMHQGVHNYTRRVSDMTRVAWRKIEGRFDTLSLIDDGVEAYEMIADAVHTERTGDCVDIARRARRAGFFPTFDDDQTLSRVLSKTGPLAPAALDVLPRLASQVAQNERTMFHCLEHTIEAADSGTVVSLDALYDYFAPAMRADVGPGGTHRRLVEAESALSRAETPLQHSIAKAVALLQLGGATQRVKLPKERLLFAVTEGTKIDHDEAEAAVDALLGRKVLIHRRRIDDVSLWHGADVDLAAMVAEEALRVSVEENIVSNLGRLFPPDAYTAPKYNHERSITRFARARFVLASDLLDGESRNRIRSEADKEDALVALVVDATADRDDLIAVAETLPSHLILALPKRMTEVSPILTDLLAVENLLERPELVETDPLVPRELYELRAETETALRHELDQLMNPDRGGVIWIPGGGGVNASSRASGALLTEIFETRFAKTPHIRNEQVVRRNVTPTARSARKRCILAILERTGLPALGYAAKTSADASIYRTVFEKTGLYRNVGNKWSWATPTELTDSNIRGVWEGLSDFFAQASDESKNFEELVDQLTAPPIGLRDGLVPLMVAVGFQAFARSVALYETIEGRRRYVDDINPSVVELVCEHPYRFDLTVVNFTTTQMRVLKGFVQMVAGRIDPHEPDLVRAFYDGLLEWKAGLPPSALTVPGLGKSASIVQPLLRRRSFDPLHFIIGDLPDSLGDSPLSKNCLKVFQAAIEEMETVAEKFALKAAEAAGELFNGRQMGKPRPLLQAAAEWANALPLDDVTTHSLDHEARGILSRSRSACNSQLGERGFITGLSGILSGTGFEEWDTESMNMFRTRLEDAIIRVENCAFDKADGSSAFEPFLKNRLASVFNRYGDKIGREKLMNYLQDIYQEGT